LKIDLKLPPRDRITNLFEQMEGLIHDHNWQSIFESEDGHKHYVRSIVNALHPMSLKKEMWNAIKWSSGLKNDPTALSDLLLEKVESFEPFLMNPNFSSPSPSTPAKLSLPHGFSKDTDSKRHKPG